jgi:acyl-CoA thioesterase-1
MKKYILKIILLFVVSCQVQAGTILVFGDSLSAGYGLAADEGWVSLLQQRLAQHELEHKVINASISGETTAGGLARLPAVLEQYRPDYLLLELGANDGLRGLSLAAMRDNLTAMIAKATELDSQVVLIGMQLPPNYGPVYIKQFTAIYQELAKRHRLPFVPFFLTNVALNPALMQGDQLHPTAAAQTLLLDTVWPTLLPLLQH